MNLLRNFAISLAVLGLYSCASEPENNLIQTSEWAVDLSQGCCIWALADESGNRTEKNFYGYEAGDGTSAFIKLEHEAVFIANDLKFSEAVEGEFSKVCKRVYGTDVLEIVSQPTIDGNRMIYPQTIEARCMSQDQYKVRVAVDNRRRAEERADLKRQQAQREAERQRLIRTNREKMLQRFREKKEISAEELESLLATRKQKCTAYGFQPETDAHAKCVMELSIAAESQAARSAFHTEQTVRATAAQVREQAIQEAKLKERKRIADMEANLRLIELGTSLMTGSATKSPTKKNRTHTYTINGQLITCHTTGSITNCF